MDIEKEREDKTIQEYIGKRLLLGIRPEHIEPSKEKIENSIEVNLLKMLTRRLYL